MYTDCKSEDVWTSLMLHERGWRSDLHPRRAGHRRRPGHHRGLHQAAAALGDRWLRDPATHNPLSPRRKLTIGPADHVPGHGDALPRRHRAAAAPARAAAGDLLRPPAGEPGPRRWAPGCSTTPGSTSCRSCSRSTRSARSAGRCLLLAAVSFPIYIAGAVQRHHRQGHQVARHGWKAPRGLTVRLHDPAGAAVHVPAADLVRGDLARHQPQPADAWRPSGTSPTRSSSAPSSALRSASWPGAVAPPRSSVTEPTPEPSPAYGHRAPRRQPCRGAHA